MWETDIIINYNYRKYLLYLKENITSSANYNKKGVFAVVKMDDTAILSIAMIDPSDKMFDEITTWVAECIIFSEKEEYIKSKKLLPNNNFKNAFLKALIMVDMSSDVELTAKEIDLAERTINLHSLYKFRLSKKLEAKWDKMLEKFFPKGEKLENDKLMDILKSIIASNKKDVGILVRKKEDAFILESDKDNIYIKATDEADVIANLILLSPNKLEISNKDEFSADGFVLLRFLFEDVLKN